MPQKSTIDEFIKKANKVHNNWYKYDNSIYDGSGKN